MNVTKKSLTLAVGGALALSVSANSFAATQNPFAIKTLASGYQVADADKKMKDGNCGEGKCSAEMKKNKTEENKEKAKEGKCSADGKCSAEMKDKAK